VGQDASGAQLDREELAQLVEAHTRSGEFKSAAFWMEKILAMEAGLPLRRRLPELASYIKILTSAGSWQAIITFISRHDLSLAHLVFACFHVNALYKREMYAEIVNLPLGYLVSPSETHLISQTLFDYWLQNRWQDVPFIGADPAVAIHVELNAEKGDEVDQRLDTFAAENNCESRLLLLLTRTYLIVQNRPAAAGCLRHWSVWIFLLFY